MSISALTRIVLAGLSDTGRPDATRRIAGATAFSLKGLEDVLCEFIDLRAAAERVSRYLGLDFVLEEAPKFGIVSVSFEDPLFFGHPEWRDELSWKDGAIARIKPVPDAMAKYVVYLNPNVDRAAAAEWLSERVGLKIYPDEVYYFAWFHECGHTRAVLGNLAPEFMLAKELSAAMPLPALRLEAERRADEWAVAELLKWREQGGPAGRPKALLPLPAEARAQ